MKAVARTGQAKKPAGGGAKKGRPPIGPPPRLKLPPGTTEKRVTFPNLKQEKLVGSLVEVAGSNKIAILCHGYASNRHGFHMPAIAVALAQKKIGSLRIDFSGNGESQGIFQYGNYRDECKDLRSAVEYLRNAGKEVLALIGHSKGGNAVLLYSSEHDDVPMTVNIAGRFKMDRGIEERFGKDIIEKLNKDPVLIIEDKNPVGTYKWELTKWSVEERLALDMAAACKDIRITEVLTIHGTADETVPFADAESIGSNICQHELFAVEGGDHSFKKSEHVGPVIEKIVNFVSTYS